MSSLVEFDIIDVVVDGDLLVHLAAAESLASPALSGASGGPGDLTGCMLWPGAAAAASYVRQQLRGRIDGVVIELGCGSGLVSAAVATSGLAAHVIATDASELALRRCAATLRANVCAPATSFQVARVPWDDAACVASLSDTVRACCHDGAPLTIVGAEIVYPSTTTATLDSLFQLAVGLCRLSGPTAFLMSYVERQPATTLAMFRAAWRAGYREWALWHDMGARSIGAAWAVSTPRPGSTDGEPWRSEADDALSAGRPIVVDWGAPVAVTSGERDDDAAIARQLPGLLARVARVQAAVEEAAAEAAEWMPPFSAT